MAYMVGEGWRDLFDVIIVEVGQIIQSPSCDVVYSESNVDEMIASYQNETKLKVSA